MPGPLLRDKNSKFVLPTDNPAPIATSEGPTYDAVVRTLVEKYGVPADQATALAGQYAGGVPDQGIASQALSDVADREVQRLKRINFYARAKQDILDGKNVDKVTRSYVDAVDAEHKRLVQERAAAAQQAARFNADFVKTHPKAWLAQGGTAIAMQARPAGTPVDMDGKRYYVQNYHPEHPVVRTAKAAMEQFGADPATAANFAMQLHGMTPEGE